MSKCWVINSSFVNYGMFKAFQASEASSDQMSDSTLWCVGGDLIAKEGRPNGQKGKT